MEENPPAKRAKLKLEPRVMYETVEPTNIPHNVTNVFEIEHEDDLEQVLEYDEEIGEDEEHLEGGTVHGDDYDEDSYEVNVQEKLKSVKGSNTKYIICQPDDNLDTFKNSWTRGMTHVLIEEYRKMIDDFQDPYKRQKDLWIALAENMCHRGCDVTWDMCDQKWRNLKHTFKSIYYNEHRSLKSKRRWDFYEILEDLFEPQINGTQIRKSRTLSPRPLDEDSNLSTVSNSFTGNASRNQKLEDGPLAYLQTVYSENGVGASYQVASSSHQTPEIDYTIANDAPETSSGPPTWFQEFMKQYRSDEEHRISLIKEMHAELLQVEKRKCVALEALLKKLGQ